MGVLHKYMFSALLVILGLTYAHGYDSRTSSKFDRLERKIETITIELYEVKAYLRKEKKKTIQLEIKLNELMDGQKVTAFDDKDSNKEVDTVQTDPEQRVYNAFYDEKQERKVFENHVNSILKDEKVKIEMKINTLNETLTAHIETQLNTLQDKVLHSVTELNDSIASIKELTSNVKQNQISLVDVEATLVELNDSCHDKDSNKEVDTVQTDPEQRVYNAFYDEKQERKVFENHVNSILKDEKVKIEMKINTLNETLTAHIETQLNTLQDKVLHSVTELNDSIASIKELTSNVKQNQISLVDVEATLVELNDSCHDKEPDEPPIANAGPDQTVQLPTNIAKLFGDRSTDDQGIVEYRWSVSSTTGRDPRIQDSNKAVLALSNLEEGDYVLTLTVIDKLGQRSSDSARVRVSPAANRPPVADAGRDYTITLPENRVTLEGSRSTDDKLVVDYSWEITSGNTRGVRLSESGSNLDVTGLKKGEYEFTLTVRDQNGLTDTDTARVVVVKQDPKDCLEVLNQNKTNVDGVYNVRSPSSGLVYPVFCDMTTDGGGWTIFQKRFDGSLDFYLTFKEYEDGFGDVNAEFWMGLKRIHAMTSHHTMELRIHLTAVDGSTAYQTYQDFSVSPGPDYKLHVGQTAGTAGDRYGLTYTNGMRFSTKDKDVDTWSKHCAVEYHGGWWYKSCGPVNLNGDYGTPGTLSSYYSGWGGVYYGFKSKESLKTTAMMFRRN